MLWEFSFPFLKTEIRDFKNPRAYPRVIFVDAILPVTNNWIEPINLRRKKPDNIVKKYVTPDQINYAQQIPNSFSYDRALIWILNSGQINTNCNRKHDST